MLDDKNNGPATLRVRLYSLDALRGLAALGVVLWHWQHFFMVDGKLPAGFERSSQPWYGALFLFYENGWVGVDLFFCLSGFVFFWLYSERVTAGMPAREFMALRFARLYPLHLATLCAAAALQAIFVARHGSPFVCRFNDWEHLRLNLVLANGWGFEHGASFNGPAWSLSVEALMYGSFFVVCRWVPVAPGSLALIVALGLFGVHNQNVSRGVIGFFAGGLTLLAWQRLSGSSMRSAAAALLPRAAVLGWAVAVAATAVRVEPAALFVTSAPEWLRDHLATLTLFPLTILVLALTESRHEQAWRRLAFLGDWSYSIYLWHFPLQMCFALILPRGAFYEATTLVAFLAVLLAVAWASHRFFERPAQRWLRRRLASGYREAAGAVSAS